MTEKLVRDVRHAAWCCSQEDGRYAARRGRVGRLRRARLWIGSAPWTGSATTCGLAGSPWPSRSALSSCSASTCPADAGRRRRSSARSPRPSAARWRAGPARRWSTRSRCSAWSGPRRQAAAHRARPAHRPRGAGRQARPSCCASRLRHAGRVKLGGEVWTAGPTTRTTASSPARSVDVVQIKGATAYVLRVHRLGVLTTRASLEREGGDRDGCCSPGHVRAGPGLRRARAREDGPDRAAGARRHRGAVRQVQDHPARRAERRRRRSSTGSATSSTCASRSSPSRRSR